MQETETKIKKTILGDINSTVTHRNEKYNRYEISRQQKKRELKKIAPLLLRTPKLVFMEAVKVMIFE